LLGLAVGDALGSGFKGKRIPAPPFTDRAMGLREMLGRGPFNLEKGQVSDVTQLATVLAQSLAFLRDYEPQETLRRYKAWEKVSFSASEYMKKALASEGQDGGRNLWLRDARRTADAGSLARVTPIAIFFAKNRSRAIEVTLADSALTHFHPRAQLSCVAFVGMMIEALVHPEPEVPFDRLLEAANDSLSEGGAVLLRNQTEFTLDIKQGVDAVRRSIDLAQKADPDLYGPEIHMWRNASWVDVPFRIALFELFQKRSYADALEDVVNRGGDAEVNAAVTGALLATLQGEEAIPREWTQQVLAALSQKAGPMRDQYHPKQLLQLLDASPKENTP
jgi:ADP-ribosylglycohydrolase